MNGHHNRIGRVISGIPLVTAGLWVATLFLIYLDLMRAGSSGAEIASQMGWGAAVGVNFLLRQLGYCAWGIPAVLSIWGLGRIISARGDLALRYGLLGIADFWLGMLAVYAVRGGGSVVFIGVLGREAAAVATEYIGARGAALVAGVAAAMITLAFIRKQRSQVARTLYAAGDEQYTGSVAALKSALSTPTAESATPARPFLSPEEDRRAAPERTSDESPDEVTGEAVHAEPALSRATVGPSATVVRLRLVLGLFMVLTGLWVCTSLVAQVGAVIAGSGAAAGGHALGTMARTFGTVILTHLGLFSFIIPALLVLWGVNRLAGEGMEVAALRSAWLATQAWVVCLVTSSLVGPGADRYVGRATAWVAEFAVDHLGMIGTALASVALAAAVVIMIRNEQAEMVRRPRRVVIFHGVGAFLRAAAFGMGFLVGRVSALTQKSAEQTESGTSRASADEGSALEGDAGVSSVVEALPDQGSTGSVHETAPSEGERVGEIDGRSMLEPARALDRDILAKIDGLADGKPLCEVTELSEEDERILAEAIGLEERDEAERTAAAAADVGGPTAPPETPARVEQADEPTPKPQPEPARRAARTRSSSARSIFTSLSASVAGLRSGTERWLADAKARRRAAKPARAKAPRRAKAARPAAGKRPSALHAFVGTLRSKLERRPGSESAEEKPTEQKRRGARAGSLRPAWGTGAAAIIIYMLIANGAYFFLLRPAQENVSALRSEKSAIHDFFVVTESSQAIERFKGSLMRGDQRITVLKDLEGYARETGVSIVGEPGLLPTSEVSENVGEHPIELTVRGAYHEIAAFVSRVEGPERFLAIRDLEIQAAEDGATEHQATLLIAAMSWRE